MGKRGKAVVTALLLLSVACFAAAAVECVLGSLEWSTNSMSVGCFTMLWALYLEVYSHRG